MARTGRPPIFNCRKQTELCTLVRAGCPIFVAARHVGVSARTVRYARQRNPDFARALVEARASCEIVAISEFHTAARRSWRASAWYLERVFPKRFGRQRLQSVRARRRSDRQFGKLVASTWAKIADSRLKRWAGTKLPAPPSVAAPNPAQPTQSSGASAAARRQVTGHKSRPAPHLGYCKLGVSSDLHHRPATLPRDFLPLRKKYARAPQPAARRSLKT